MNKKFLLLIMAFFSLSVVAETVPTELVVSSKDGTKVSYNLGESPKISFAGDNLVITANDIEVSYELKQMALVTYENTDATNIVNVNGEKMESFNLNGESLLFPAKDTDVAVKIYTVDGQLTISRNVSKGETLSIPLNDLSRGIYLVYVNGITYKIMKR